MNRSRLVFGPVFLVVGGLLLAEQAGTVDAWSVAVTWWPTVLLLTGVIQLVTRPRNAVGGVTMLAVGVALLLLTLGVIDTLALLWPILLIGAGAWLVVGRARSGPHEEGAEVIDVFAAFEDRTVRATGGPCSGGSIITLFGDVRLDLAAANPLPPRGSRAITFQITTLFGDVEVLVPPDWQVEVSGPEVFGDVHVPTPPTRRSSDDRGPVLLLRTLLLAGDVTVHTSDRKVPVASEG